MTSEQLAEIEIRCDAATPGPWAREGSSVVTRFPSHQMTGKRVFYYSDGSAAGQYMGICRGALSCPYWEQELADLDFIAHARDDVVALLAEIAKLRDELAQEIKAVL